MMTRYGLAKDVVARLDGGGIPCSKGIIMNAVRRDGEFCRSKRRPFIAGIDSLDSPGIMSGRQDEHSLNGRAAVTQVQNTTLSSIVPIGICPDISVESSLVITDKHLVGLILLSS